MLKFERATRAASDAIYRVMRDTWDDTYGGYFSEEKIQEARRTWLDALALDSVLDDAHTFFELARDETNTILGFVAARTMSSGDLYVLRLYVHPDHQERGIGTALLNAALTAFPTAPTIRLDVEDRNQKAITFWERHGFLATGRKEAVVAGTIIRLIEMARRCA